MSITTSLSPGVVARLHLHPGEDYGFIVALARPPLEAVPAALLRPGTVSAVMTHDRGMSWPDLSGEALMAAILAEGGGVLLQFETLADALACMRELEGKPGRPLRKPIQPSS